MINFLKFDQRWGGGVDGGHILHHKSFVNVTFHVDENTLQHILQENMDLILDVVWKSHHYNHSNRNIHLLSYF